MKTISLHTNHPNDFDSAISSAINVYPISDFINWIEIELTPSQDFSIKLNDPTKTSMHFVYNLKDACVISTTEKTKIKELQTYQSGIIHEKQANDTFIKMQKGGNYHLCIIEFNKYNYEQLKNSFFLEFEKVFKTSSTSYYFLHTGLPNLQLFEYVNLILAHPKEKLSDKLMVAGYINMVLSIKLDQFLSHNKQAIDVHYLRPSEFKKVQDIMAAIHKFPEDDYNLERLCERIGLNATKLQFAFKEMQGKTVCNYVSHVRLLKAEELLKVGELNISEIVYSLGWTSRSYFSKIFKEKFQCTPRSFQLNFIAGSA